MKGILIFSSPFVYLMLSGFSGTSTSGNILIFFFAILIGIILYAIYAYNKMKSQQLKISESFSNISVYLEQRYDEISAIYKIAKEYQLHESQTFQEIVKLRQMATSQNFSFAQKNQINNKIEERIPSMLATFENYPELRSNTNFLQLQEAISDNEDNISASRASYNGYVNQYNTSISLFPAVLLAKTFNFKSEEMYDAPDNKKGNPLL